MKLLENLATSFISAIFLLGLLLLPYACLIATFVNVYEQEFLLAMMNFNLFILGRVVYLAVYCFLKEYFNEQN